MKAQWIVLLASLAAGAAVPAFGHHSFAAEFDAQKPVTLKGPVTKVDWLNPHIWIYLDVKDETGAVAHWQCEGGAPNALTRQGWNKNSLKVGEEVTIEGYRAKDATNSCSSRIVTTAEGRRAFVGSAEDGGPKTGAPAKQ